MSAARPRTIARLTITGMTSVHAARAIYTALGSVEGVLVADVGRGIATVEHDGSVTAAALHAAVALAGFEISDIREERRTLPVL